MARSRFDAGDDAGETLLEVVISLAILSIALVAVFGSIVLGIKDSNVHRYQVNVSAALRDYAEAIEADVATSGYQSSCAPTYGSSYVPPSALGVATPQIVRVVFWTGSAFQASCSVSGDIGVEQLTLQAASSNGLASQQLVIVVRKPCGPGQTCSL